MVNVPIIDVSALLEGRRAIDDVAQAIDAACREVGFFYVVGHGVPPAVRTDLATAAREFFALPDAQKDEIAMRHAGSAWRGWFPVGGELTSGVPDLKEGLYFGASEPPSELPLHGPNLYPRWPAVLEALVEVYLVEMTRLGQAILGAMAVGLGLPRLWFVEHLTADPLILFRIFHYPPGRDHPGWGVAEHTDYGLLTILGQDDLGGLQVKSRDGWIDAPPVPDSFVCNLGDMLERLTGGQYVSTAHRVRNDSTQGRLSFPFFLDPSWDAVVDRLPIVPRPDDDRAAQRWDHTSVHGFRGTYGEYITEKVAKVFPELVQ